MAHFMPPWVNPDQIGVNSSLQGAKIFGRMAELAYASDLKSDSHTGLRVRVPLWPQKICSRGGIGIRDSLRSYARKGVGVRVSPRARFHQ